MPPQDPDTASDLPLRSSVVQRLQRFATYGHLKQLVLRMIADELGAAPSSQQEAQVLGCGGRLLGIWCWRGGLVLQSCILVGGRGTRWRAFEASRSGVSMVA